MDNIFIHTGHNSYDKALFNKIRNVPLFVKPTGGLWGSPIDSSLDWTSFVNRENFEKQKYGKSSFKFRLNTTKILYINSVNDLDRLPHLNTYENVLGKHLSSSYDELDFEKLAEIYDAMVVYISADYNLYYRLYGWDVDSVLVFNPNVVEVVE